MTGSFIIIDAIEATYGGNDNWWQAQFYIFRQGLKLDLLKIKNRAFLDV